MWIQIIFQAGPHCLTVGRTSLGPSLWVSLPLTLTLVFPDINFSNFYDSKSTFGEISLQISKIYNRYFLENGLNCEFKIGKHKTLTLTALSDLSKLKFLT